MYIYSIERVNIALNEKELCQLDASAAAQIDHRLAANLGLI